MSQSGSGQVFLLPCPAWYAYAYAPCLPASGGNFLDGVAGKSGAVYLKHGGMCLETQGFSDAPNQPSFPSVLLPPTQAYRHDMVYSQRHGGWPRTRMRGAASIAITREGPWFPSPSSLPC